METRAKLIKDKYDPMSEETIETWRRLYPPLCPMSYSWRYLWNLLTGRSLNVREDFDYD